MGLLGSSRGLKDRLCLARFLKEGCGLPVFFLNAEVGQK